MAVWSVFFCDVVNAHVLALATDVSVSEGITYDKIKSL